MLQATWIELPVHDIERAAKFYQTVFDFAPTEIREDGGVRHITTLSAHGSETIGISLTQTRDFEPGANGTLIYLAAGEDLTGHLNRIEPAGGKLLTQKVSMGDAGFYAMFLDTEGNRLALNSFK